jgi:hypothetical protein
MASFAAWIESTRIASTIGASMWLIASLSAAHVVGYALLIGAALVTNLKWMGLLAPKLAHREITGPAHGGVHLGLAISVVTGVLLVSWKASTALANGIFQLKMLLLVAAVVFQATWRRRVEREPAVAPGLMVCMAGIGVLLWLGLALAGSAYILLE